MLSLIAGWQKMGSTNLDSASTTFPSYGSTEPVASATRAVVAVPKRSNGMGPTVAECLLFGAGSENNTMRGTMVRWSRAGSGFWLPTPAWRVGGTLSTFVGAASGMIVTTDRVVDTIDYTTSGFHKDDGTLILSPANNTPAIIRFDIGGAEYLELVGDINGSATNFNALLRYLD